MTKVEIELDTLRLWFNKLDMNESEEVTELIYDKIQEYELQIKDEEFKKAKKRAELDTLAEKTLGMNEIVINDHYRIKKQPGFKTAYASLAGAEVRVISKARTKVTILIVEPNNQFTGQSLKTNLNSLTTL